MPLDAPFALILAHGLAFAELYSDDGARRIDRLFLDHLAATDDALARRLDTARENPDALARKDESDLIIALGPHLDDFIASLCGIEAVVRELERAHHELAPLFVVKRL